MINQYGRLTKLSSEFVEAISKHSPILKFVETSNWSSLGNYFEDRKEGNIGWDQRKDLIGPVPFVFLGHFRSSKVSNDMVLSNSLILVIVSLKVGNKSINLAKETNLYNEFFSFWHSEIIQAFRNYHKRSNL